MLSNSYLTGIISEFYARCFLRLHGFKILKKRYRTGKNTNRAEIDIIAQKKDLIVFCEVKYRKNVELGWEAISDFQIKRLRRAAETFLMRSRWKGSASFDVLIVCKFKIFWFKNAI